jgi:hypothetical protein
LELKLEKTTLKHLHRALREVPMSKGKKSSKTMRGTNEQQNQKVWGTKEQEQQN